MLTGTLSFFTFAANAYPDLFVTVEDNPTLAAEIEVVKGANDMLYAFLPKTLNEETFVMRSYYDISGVSGEALVSFDPVEDTIVCRAENGGSVTVNGYTVLIFKGSLPVMDIEIGRGHGLYEIHQSKDVKIPVTVGVSGTEEGEYDLSPAAAEMKTRGYTTFSYPKKPYQIKFDKKTDLFGMGKAKKWILLANYIDGTAVRNKVVFDIGEEIGCAYTSKSVFIDLYVNGKYLGVYQLTEKVEIGSSRVDLSDDYGVLLELDVKERMEADDIYFTTSTTGKAVVYKDYVTDFENTTDEDVMEQTRLVKSYVRNYINRFEMLLYSGNTTWEEIESMIDVDSFIRYYFISEFTEEVDATFASTFFYMDGKDDVLHCAPLWDYDRCLGYGTGYEMRTNANFMKSITVSTDSYRVEWFKHLFRHDEFAKRVNEFYDEYVKDAIDADRVNADVDALQSEMWDSLMMNYARWPYIFYDIGTLTYEIDEIADSSVAEQVEYVTDDMKEWISERSAFMNRAYGADIPIIHYSVADSKGNFGKTYTGGLTLEGFNAAGLKVSVEDCGIDGGIEYSIMYAGKVYGPASDGEEVLAASDRITGVQVQLIGNIANYYSVEYRYIRADNTSSSWYSNGQIAGSKMGSFSLYGNKAIEIRLLRRKYPESASIVANVMGESTTYDGIVGNRAVLEDPSVPDYRFDGWYDNPEFDGTPVTDIVFGTDSELYALMTEIPFMRGDANFDGYVDMRDVLLTRRYIAGLTNDGAIHSDRADLNGDGSVTMADVLILRRIIAGISE
jgi:hypothetical protein